MADSSDSNNMIFLLFCYSGNSTVISVCLFLIALFLSASFVVSLYMGAIESCSASILKKQSEAGKKQSLKAMKYVEEDTRFRRSARIISFIGIATAEFLTEYISLYSVCGILASLVHNKMISAILAPVLIFIITVIMFVLIFSLLPEKLGEKNADSAIIRAANVFSITNALFRPITAPIMFLSDIIVGVSEKNTEKGSNQLTEDEIMLMVDEGEENGFIEGNTKDMIENVFEFDDTSVGEIMTHRKDVIAVRDDARITDVVETAIRSGRSRMPVYHEDIDDIVGIIHVKDLLKFVSTNAPKGKIGKDIIKKAVFVPESKRCSEMFEYMTSHKTQIAVVVDEFGGTGGIITMEDLIESIVGSIQDEYDNEDDDIKQLSAHSFTVDGATPLDEITELTGISFEDEENDTIAGVILDKLGYIPKNSEHPSIDIGKTRFTVQEVENRRIAKVIIVKRKENNGSENKKAIAKKENH